LIVASGTVRVLLGNGDGTFQTTHVSYAAGGDFVALGDFNGDGFPDAVTANFSSNDVSILLNDGAWTGPGPGGAPGAGGGRAPSAPDLFLGEELAGPIGRALHRLAAPAILPHASPPQAAARGPRRPPAAPGRPAGAHPAPR